MWSINQRGFEWNLWNVPKSATVRLWISKFIHDFLIIHDKLHHDVEQAITMCMSSLCSTIHTMCVAALVNKRSFYVALRQFCTLLHHCFCCSQQTNCGEMGLQSSCASNNRKLVDKAVCLVVGRHRMCIWDAIRVLARIGIPSDL